MQKKRVVVRQTEVIDYFCDVCKNPSMGRKCSICKIDVCEKCLHREYDVGDYPIYYCQKCYKLGEPYRAKIKELEDETDKKISDLTDEWEKLCKDAVAVLGSG